MDVAFWKTSSMNSCEPVSLAAISSMDDVALK
jgi:hypothetical protein